MPDLSLTVTTAQWNRIKACEKFQYGSGVDATAADMTRWIKGAIREAVTNELHRTASVDFDATNATTLDGEGWNE